MQKTIIITTVGTSVFENYLKDKTVSEHQKRDFRTDYNNLKEEALPFSKWDSCKDELDELEESITSWYHNNPNASAEIKSILKIAEQTKGEVEVYLIATDTVLSVKAAELVGGWFDGNRGELPVFFETPNKMEEQEDSDYVIKNLQILNQSDYERGLHNLIDILDRITTKNKKIDKKERRNLVLNITGGYKAIIPILTIYGQLEGIPVKYLFNDTDLGQDSEIIQIGNLPISFDSNIVYTYYPFYTDRISVEIESLNQQEIGIYRKLSKDYGLFQEEENQFVRTVLGRLLNSYAFFKAPESVQVLGTFIEYKLAEYYTESQKEYTVKRDKPIIEDSPIKYDLIFKNERKTILVEVKSAAQVYEAFKPKENPKYRNLSQQIQNQFDKDIIPNEMFPDEYHIYFYFIGRSIPDMDLINENLKKLKTQIEYSSKGRTEFKAQYFLISADLQKDSTNNSFKNIFQKDFKFRSTDFYKI
jgi:hypothetical protein